MDAITAIARRHSLTVIEDNAHGLFAQYRGKPLGTFGALATQSFHETKNFTCGEGGALIVNDPSLVERAEIVREKGTNRANFFRGMVDKYTWVSEGSSYLPSDVLSAFLLAQLEAKDAIQQARQTIWERYAQTLSAWAARSGVQMPFVPDHCRQSYHLFYLIMPTLDARAAFIRHLMERNIVGVFHYVPLHRSPMAHTLGSGDAICPVTDSISDRLVRLPMYNDMSASDQDRVLAAVEEFAVA
jgi:dTDP-4-amino-4,6-dideoxygalactose transaminase